MADAGDARIVATPSQPPAPYDATDTGAAGPWAKVKSGPADASGNVTGDWPDSGPWRQT